MKNSKIVALQEAIEEEPKNAFAHFALAREYIKINDRVNARQQYQFLVDHIPEYGGTYYHFVLLLWEMNDLPAARSIFDQGVHILRRYNETHLLNELKALEEQWPE